MLLRASNDKTAGADRHRRRTLLFCALVLVAAGYALTMVVFYPGYATIDAQYVYADAKAWQFGDWQSPAMAVLWRLIDPVAPGAASMFMLTATLYWLSFGLLALAAAVRSARVALVAPLVALMPPAFFFVGMIWRDVLFAVVWLIAAVVSFVIANAPRRLRLCARCLAVLLIAFGVLLRPNAIFAAPLIAAYAIWPDRFELRRIAVAYIPLLLLACALIPTTYYGLLGAKRQHPLHSILVFDLGGITHFSGENQFPVSFGAEETGLLTSRCYDPVRWDTYWHWPPCPFVMRRLEQPDDRVFGTTRLVEAWLRAVTTHPLAYLEHRATVTRQFLAHSNLVLPVWDWEKPDATYGHQRVFRALIALHDALQPSLLFRPGLWLLIAFAVAVAAWRVRAHPAGAFALTVGTAAVVYVATFFVVGVAADFRYAYWCVLAALAGGLGLAIARVQERCEASETSPNAPSR